MKNFSFNSLINIDDEYKEELKKSNVTIISYL